MDKSEQRKFRSRASVAIRFGFVNATWTFYLKAVEAVNVIGFAA